MHPGRLVAWSKHDVHAVAPVSLRQHRRLLLKWRHPVRRPPVFAAALAMHDDGAAVVSWVVHEDTRLHRLSGVQPSRQHRSLGLAAYPAPNLVAMEPSKLSPLATPRLPS